MKNTPRTLLFSLVGMIALLGVACTSEPTGNGSGAGGSSATANPKDRFFRYNIGAAPRSLDPGKATEIPASVVIKNTFEGLTRPVPSGAVEPAAAESWEISDDGKTYTFHLREDGRWSNGDPVTAHDFYESWMRVLDPDFIAEYAYAMYMIEGAQEFKETEAEGDARPGADTVGLRAVDDLTFEVTLVAPTPYLLSFMDHSCFMPVHESARNGADGWANRPETYISNGPYSMTKFEPGQEIVVERNEHYRDFNEIELKGLSFRMIENATTALTEFRTGGIDGIHSDLDTADIPILREEGILRSGPELSTYFVCFQTQREPFNDINARKAFALAINREQLTKVMNTGDRASTTFVPPGLKMADGRDFRDAFPAPWQDNQPGVAKEALKAAGYDDPSTFPTVTYLFNTTNRHKLVAEFLQNQWKTNLGVSVNVQNQEFKVLIENRSAGEYLVCRHGWVGDYPDPMTFLDMFTTVSGNNDAKWFNEEYDALIEQSRIEQDNAKRMELLAQAEKLLLDNYVIAPLFHYVSNYVMSDEIEGVERDIMQTVRFDRARWK